MKLFKNIEGNRFKLSEERILDMKTGVSSEEKLVGSSYQITKEEEGRALQYIKRDSIPAAILAYNYYIERQKGLGARRDPVTEKEVRMNLKKSARVELKSKESPLLSDMIRYTSKVDKGRVSMTFDIIKTPHNLYVEWHHPLEDYAPGSRRTTIYNTELREGKVISIKEGQKDFYITKEEERRAYTYLVRQVVPSAIEDLYLVFLRRYPQMYPEKKYPKITAQNVARNVKKQRINIDSITYESVINNHVYFTFIIKKQIVKTKSQDGKDIRIPVIMIGAQGPINVDWKWYEIK